MSLCWSHIPHCWKSHVTAQNKREWISPEFSSRKSVFYPFHSGYQLTGTLVKSEDPDEMPHNAIFHQGLHCLQRCTDHRF